MMECDTSIYYINYICITIMKHWNWSSIILGGEGCWSFKIIKLKTKNSKKMAMIVFHHFFFLWNSIINVHQTHTPRNHFERSDKRRMSVCNFHYNKRLVRGLRNFFSSFLLPCKWLSYSRSCAVNQLFLFYMSLKRGVLFGV